MITIGSPSRPARRLPATLAVLTMAFAVGACGASDDAEHAETQSIGVDDEATTTSAADESAVTTDEAAAAVPQDSDLDIEVRSPDGTTLTLSHIAFDGDNILLDMEIVNGNPGRISVHQAFMLGQEDDLRLIDEDGNICNFVLPPEDQSSGYLDVLQGERLNGTFAFLGPLIGHPDRLRLVTNVATDQIDSWSVDYNVERGAASPGPGFVVPIDLTWD